MTIKSIAVFCGSKEGHNKMFIEDAIELAGILVDKKITLIYGGGGFGIMGAIADEVLRREGKVIGIIPSHLISREKQHTSLTELHEVDNMHIRKQMLYENCDAAIILPGGFGTLDEMFEIITWNQLKLHNKKIILLNSDGFYNHLIQHLRTMEQEGFLYDKIEDKITIINEPSELREILNTYSSSH